MCDRALTRPEINDNVIREPAARDGGVVGVFEREKHGIGSVHENGQLPAGHRGARRPDDGRHTLRWQTAAAHLASDAARIPGRAAVTLLLYAHFTVGLPTLAGWALLLFLIAAAGGAFLNLNYHWKMLPLPKGLIVGHAGVAVVGFLLLLAATWAATRA